MEQSVSRRGFLGAAIGTGAAAAIAPTAAFAHGRGRDRDHDHGHGSSGSVPRSRRSSQLYSWRRIMDASQADAERMLRALSKMGYTQVERAGTYGWTAQQYKRVLDRYDLWAHSSHDGFDLDPANSNWLEDWKPAVAYANDLDQRFIGFAWFGPPYDSEDRWHFIAQRFNEAGEYAKSQGLQFFYHNHDFEFTNRFDGKPAYDILLEETDRDDVKFELDLYWIVYGGESPVHYLADDPARYPLYHVKDKTWRDRPNEQDWEDVGPGSIDFPDIFDAGDGRRLDKHFVIEHDWPLLSHPDDEDAELKTAYAGVEYLRNVRW
jgi:sugar phosphate isomerase/epimerase